MTVDVLAQLSIAPGQRTTVLALLDELVAATRREPGNREYRLYTSPATALGGDGVLVRESYVDEEALAAHRSSPHYQRLVPQILDCLAGPIVVHRLEPIADPTHHLSARNADPRSNPEEHD